MSSLRPAATMPQAGMRNPGARPRRRRTRGLSTPRGLRGRRPRRTRARWPKGRLGPSRGGRTWGSKAAAATTTATYAPVLRSPAERRSGSERPGPRCYGGNPRCAEDSRSGGRRAWTAGEHRAAAHLAVSVASWVRRGAQGAGPVSRELFPAASAVGGRQTVGAVASWADRIQGGGPGVPHQAWAIAPPSM